MRITSFAVDPQYANKVLELVVKQRNTQALLRTPDDLPELVAWALSFLPDRRATHVFTVVTHDGMQITEHDHEEDVVLYYVEPADTPLIVENEVYLPQRGELVFMPKHVKHSVPPNSTPVTRVTVAIKV